MRRFLETTSERAKRYYGQFLADRKCSARNCNGLGVRVEIDPDLVIPDDSLTIDEGALKPWGADLSTKKSWSGLRTQVLRKMKVPLNVPWKKLPKKAKDALLFGLGAHTPVWRILRDCAAFRSWDSPARKSPTPAWCT